MPNAASYLMLLVLSFAYAYALLMLLLLLHPNPLSSFFPPSRPDNNIHCSEAVGLYPSYFFSL